MPRIISHGLTVLPGGGTSCAAAAEAADAATAAVGTAHAPEPALWQTAARDWVVPSTLNVTSGSTPLDGTGAGAA